MNRRKFFGTTLAGTAALGAEAAASTIGNQSAMTQQKGKSPKKALMKVGHQHYSSDPVLRMLAGFGVNNICSALPSKTFDENWSVEGLMRLRERVESFGIMLDMIPLPLSSTFIMSSENPNIMLGKSPERDREIEQICRMIRNAAQAGISAVKYNMTILNVVRTKSTRGRGGASYSTFIYENAKQDPLPSGVEAASAEMMWERITYFLKRVVPVAEEHRVRMCCHPHDPAMPRDKGFRGIHTVLGSVEGLKRFVDITPSKYHGLNFCQGTVSEMLVDPNKEIFDVIRYFGNRGKIFNVHFRNIKGGFLNFQETFPDDGDVDMVKAMRTYHEVGYDGMIMPDHVPDMDGDNGNTKAYAFAFGYIQALIQMVKSES